MVVSLSVVPVGEGVELKKPVAEILEIIDASGLPYRLTAMATEIEGTWEEVMPVVRAAHEKGRSYSGRVLTHIVIDDRADASGRLEGKVEDVESQVGRPLGRKRV